MGVRLDSEFVVVLLSVFLCCMTPNGVLDSFGNRRISRSRAEDKKVNFVRKDLYSSSKTLLIIRRDKYGGPKVPRQFQFDHGNFNLTTALSI